VNRHDRRQELKKQPQQKREVPKTPMFSIPKEDIERQAKHIARVAFVGSFLDEEYIAQGIIELCTAEAAKAALNARNETEEKLEKWLVKHGIDPLNPPTTTAGGHRCLENLYVERP